MLQSQSERMSPRSRGMRPLQGKGQRGREATAEPDLAERSWEEAAG